ncbi:conserved hypothetical protein [Ahrensia sp. R2A130]|nr:conserved hypothetical protein [Ahrensia sp. R2A130]
MILGDELKYLKGLGLAMDHGSRLSPEPSSCSDNAHNADARSCSQWRPQDETGMVRRDS